MRLSSACLVFRDGLGQLIGTRRVGSAKDTFQQRFHLVNGSAFYKAGDPLQVTAATADKANVA